jgi:trimeric autotransporter adhesin
MAQTVYPEPTPSGLITGTAFASTGLTGATAGSRYVGATATGAPSTGAFIVGDYVIARDGTIWICTAAGSPGTWTQVSGGGDSGHPGAGTESIALGTSAAALTNYSLALGGNAQAFTAAGAIAIGAASGANFAPWASGAGSIAIGNNVSANGPRASGAQGIAIGSGDAARAGARATAADSIAFGRGAAATHTAAIAVGLDSATTAANQIRLGTTAETVSIPGEVDCNDLEARFWMGVGV